MSNKINSIMSAYKAFTAFESGMRNFASMTLMQFILVNANKFSELKKEVKDVITSILALVYKFQDTKFDVSMFEGDVGLDVNPKSLLKNIQKEFDLKSPKLESLKNLQADIAKKMSTCENKEEHLELTKELDTLERKIIQERVNLFFK